ncbi:MAG: histidine phosphatase family protein [Pirellulales bacterium]
MKHRLIVMRHAKSSWDSPAETDHDRPLNDRGRRDAPAVAARLVELGWSPEVVLSSDSRRTRETFERMQPVLSPAGGVEYLSSLYHASIEALCEALLTVSDDVRVVLALGHNPGWQQAVYWLSGESIEMKTATAALLECDAADWQSSVAAREQWRLADTISPRAL